MNEQSKPTAAEVEQKAQKIKFLEHHVPGIHSGNYKFSVTQEIWSKPGVDNPVALAADGLSLSIAAAGRDLPATGKSEIAAVKTDGTWQFRIFDARGEVLRTARADQLAERNGAVDALAAKLDPLPPGAVTAEAQRADLAGAITALLGVTFEAHQTLTVAGERYALNPQDLVAVFPPPNSLGDHANVLPHVVLNRSTLPWERLATKDAPDDAEAHKRPIPWMALLVFTNTPENPAPKPRTINLGSDNVAGVDTLYGNRTVSYLRPEWLEVEGGETDDQRVQIIDVPWETLKPALPTRQDMAYLSHVRQRANGFNDPVGAEHAVIVANRLSERGAPSTAFLVSMEHRFSPTGFDLTPDALKAGPSPVVRLVVLKSWRFECLAEAIYTIPAQVRAAMTGPEWTAIREFLDDPARGKPLIDKEFPDFKHLQRHLTGLSADDVHKLVVAARGRSLSFKGLLMELNADLVRLPPAQIADVAAQNAEAGKALAQGNLLLPHELRNGQSTASWYRGPLALGATEALKVTPHARAADQLLRYDNRNQMLDASYAAAWELGRMMMLNAKPVSLAMFAWKRAQAAHFKSAAMRAEHLPFSRLPDRLEMPELLRGWVYRTALLDGIPANYLIPDGAMLPKEGIRFFQLDQAWLESLLDGAFSIGRQNSNDVAREAQFVNQNGTALDHALCDETGRPWPKEGASGALIRSDVVAGWPHLLVDGIALLSKDETAAHGLNRDSFVRLLGLPGTLDDAAFACLEPLGMGLPGKGKCTPHMVKEDTDGAPKSWILTGPGEAVLCRIDRPLDDATRLDITLPRLRLSHLSKNTVMALFHGRVDAVDVHMKPEAVHFGVTEPDPRHPDGHYKQLRDRKTGHEMAGRFVEHLPWRKGPDGKADTRVLDVAALADNLAGALRGKPVREPDDRLSSAEFALQMVEGVARVRYLLG